jgi:hypothetical protein
MTSHTYTITTITDVNSFTTLNPVFYLQIFRKISIFVKLCALDIFKIKNQKTDGMSYIATYWSSAPFVTHKIHKML